MLQASGRSMPFLLVSGAIGEDAAVEAMRNGAERLPAEEQPRRLVPALLHAIEASETRRARQRADRELGAVASSGCRELAQHLQTSVETERAAIAREIHDDVGGSLTALKFDLAWIDRHADDARGARARAVGARDRDARDRGEPARDAQPAPGDPRAGPGRRRCNGWPAASSGAPASTCRSRTSHETLAAAGRACRWWPTAPRRRR